MVSFPPQLGVCLKNPQRAENASFKTWVALFFRAIGLAIPLKNEIAQNLKSAILFSARIFQTHPITKVGQLIF